MRKRLITLAGALLIGGASAVATAVPASAASLATTDMTALTGYTFPSSLVSYADTSTGTSTGTGTALWTFGSYQVTAAW